MTTKKTDSPLSRWSQRKIQVREGEVPPEPEVETPSVEAQKNLKTDEQEPLSETDEQQGSIAEEEEIDPEKFKNFDYDSLDYSSDYKQFMAKGVPQMVQRRALRALWNSDPILANLDGLNDYDEDFTDASIIGKGIESAWNVGKGYMTDEDEEPVDDELETAQTSEDEPASPTASEQDQVSEKPDEDHSTELAQNEHELSEDEDSDRAIETKTS